MIGHEMPAFRDKRKRSHPRLHVESRRKALVVFKTAWKALEMLGVVIELVANLLNILRAS